MTRTSQNKSRSFLSFSAYSNEIELTRCHCPEGAKKRKIPDMSYFSLFRARARLFLLLNS